MEAKSPNFPEIIRQRSEVLIREKNYRPFNELKKSIKRVKIRANFKNALLKGDNVSLICEYKPASPSMGHISNRKVEDVLPVFETAGVSAASILTEKSFFKSSIQNLKMACKTSKLPLLRKDFIMDEYQIYESRASGASAVLLMADLYPNLTEGIQLSKYLGMDALVECKNEEEIKIALDAGAEIIGINNRDFNDFSIDLKRTKKLAAKIPQEMILVSESGVKTTSDVEELAGYGADALLVGTYVMGSNNIIENVRTLVDATRNSHKNSRKGIL